MVVLFNHMGDPRAAALDAARCDARRARARGHRRPGARLGGPLSRAGDRAGGEARSAAGWAPQPALHKRPGAARPGGGRLRQRGGAAPARGRGRRHGASGRSPDEPARPLHGRGRDRYRGVFRNEELGAELAIVFQGGVPYGACAGELGQGAMQPLVPFGGDVWLLPCPRALDYSPPGDWTLHFRRDPDGKVAGLQLGCWLARGWNTAGPELSRARRIPRRSARAPRRSAA